MKTTNALAVIHSYGLLNFLSKGEYCHSKMQFVIFWKLGFLNCDLPTYGSLFNRRHIALHVVDASIPSCIH